MKYLKWISLDRREINSSCGEKEFHGRDSISEGTLKMRRFLPQFGIARESHSRWKIRPEQTQSSVRGPARTPDGLLIHG